MSNYESQSLSLDNANQIVELDDNELDVVSGGWGWEDFKEGLRDAGEGLAAGLNGQENKENNFNYLGGYILGAVPAALGNVRK